MSAHFSQVSGPHSNPISRSFSIAERSILHEEAFQRILCLETKRAQRSQKLFLLALLEMECHLPSEQTRITLGKILSILDSTTRDTDVTGWYKSQSVVGVMFTEIAIADRSAILATIIARMNHTLRGHLTPREFTQLGTSFHVFQEEQLIERIRPSATVSPLHAATLGVEQTVRLG